MVGLPKIHGRDKGLVLVAFIYVLYVIFPLFADLTHMPVFVPALAVVGYVSVAYPFVYKCRPMCWLVVYIALLFLYSIAGKPIVINGVSSEEPFLWRITIESAWIMPSVMIAYVLQTRDNGELGKIFGNGALFLLSVSFLYVLPIISASKNILRSSLFNEQQGPLPPGLPGYDLMHAYTLLTIPLVYKIKYANVFKERMIAICLSVLFFYVVIQTSITTSLFVAALIILFGVVYSAENSYKVFFGAIVLGTLFFVLYHTGFFLGLIESLMTTFEGTAVEPKLQDMYDSMISGKIQGGSITGRLDYHQISQDSFWQNPITGGGNVGGHSKIWDMLGGMGLVVFIPYAMVIWSCLKMQLQNQPRRIRSFLIFAYIAALVYLYEKGIFGDPGYLAFLVVIPSAIRRF